MSRLAIDCVAIAILILVSLVMIQAAFYHFIELTSEEREGIKRIKNGNDPKRSFRFYNPTVLRVGDNYHVLHRRSNYTACSKILPGKVSNLSSEIYYSILDKNFNSQTPKVLLKIPNDTTKRVLNQKEDHEDARLFRDCFSGSNSLFILTNTKKYTPYSSMVFTELKSGISTVFDSGHTDKNWTFLKQEDRDSVYMITWFSPFTLVKCFIRGENKGKIHTVYSEKASENYPILSGSTPIIRHPRLGLIALVHRKDGTHEYGNYWIQLSETFPHTPTHISKRFCLTHDDNANWCGIEFACGLTLDENDDFIVTYGIWDCHSLVGRFSEEQVIESFTGKL